ncbi:hypothetical protein L2E82_10324 [Cichorium intybus]|uniref:Uncharacterized protein n=1 Tax=Cichorium intybus TaxID=13427 RepID=A0ACB9GB96_CICIN|nr:hypothetical protein L2E82_10324 [Cichorium intybus]
MEQEVNFENMEKTMHNQGEEPEKSNGYHHPMQMLVTEDNDNGVGETEEVQLPREENEELLSDTHKHAETTGGVPSLKDQNFEGPTKESKSKSLFVEPVLVGPGGPSRVETGASSVPDLNNSPISSGFFPFIEGVEDEVENPDLGMDEVIEQEITDEIDRKRRNRKKVSKYSKKHDRRIREETVNSLSSGGSGSSRGEEINRTMEMGSKLGINWVDKEDLVARAIESEGGKFFR